MRQAFIIRKRVRPGTIQIQNERVMMGGMYGGGIVSDIRKMYKLGTVGDLGKTARKYGQAAADLAFGEKGTAISNVIPNSDSLARDQFPGEKHALLKLSNGKMGRGNFMGPGTQVMKRLQRGDPGRTPSDSVAKRHDIDYMLAKNLGDVRTADERMIRSLKRIEENGLDSKFNTRQGMLVGAKVLGEKLGALDRNAFSQLGSFKNTAADVKLLKAARQQMTQEGYGASAKKQRVSKKLPPGLKLRRKLLASHKPRRAAKKYNGDMAESVRAIMSQLSV